MKDFLKLLAALLLAFTFALPSAAAAQPAFALLESLLDPGTNAQAGAQQGFSVALDGNIAITGSPYDRVGADSSGVVKVYNATSGALLHTLTNPSPATLDQFGYSVAISGTRVVVGAPSDDTGATDTGSAYVYDLASASPTVPVAVLIDPTLTIDYFGSSVAISGARVVVGAFQSDPGGYNAGSAYVYDLASASPTNPIATLNNPYPGFDEYFGYSVAISGTRVVVGAYQNFDGGAYAPGSAYVYDLVSASPTNPIFTLEAPNHEYYGFFGISVGISDMRVVVGSRNDNGSAFIFDLSSPTPTVPVMTFANPTGNPTDLFGDSVGISGTRVIVGAYRESTGATYAGSAYVYDLASGVPTGPVATIHKPNPAYPDSFGYSVAISGTRAVVGAYLDDTGGENAGNAYVYDTVGPTPTSPLITLNYPSPNALDYFGYSVAVSGSLVVVGSTGSDIGGRDLGAVYIFDLASATTTLPTLTITNPNPAGSDGFGYSVAVFGTQVAVGAYNHDSGVPGAGSVYIYDVSSANPNVCLITLDNPDSLSADHFGSALSLSGSRLVVGAQLNNTGARHAGIAYLYDLACASPTVPTQTFTNPMPVSGGAFGHSVSISEARIVIGGVQGTTGGKDGGVAYVYDLTSPTPDTPMVTLTNPSPAFFDVFGSSVAVSGTHVVVGALYDDTGNQDSGSAYVYDMAGATPSLPVLTLTNPSPAYSDTFGYPVQISGTRVVVGAYQDDTHAEDAGIAYVYDLAGVTPGVPIATLCHPNPISFDHFGYSVAIDGGIVVVGSPLVDGSTTDRGSAYVFGKIAPALRINTAGNLATISWSPTNSPGFVLQYTDSLTSTNWINAVSGTTNPASLPMTNMARFYRLVQP